MPQTHGRFIDVAPNYRTGAGPSENGHYTLYHDDLREAARRLGWEALTLVDRDQPADERVVPCLDGSDHVRMAESVGAQVRDDDLVVVYEGSLPVLSAVCGIAGAHPHARFVVNLFSTEGGLDGRDHIPPEVGELPPNVFVTAETDRRASDARRLGVSCHGTWRLHSTLHDITVEPETPDRSSGGPELRVLIPLSTRGYSSGVVHDIAYVVKRLGDATGRGRIRIRWTLTGAESTKPSAIVRGQALEKLGVDRIIAPHDKSGYAGLFAAHDVVWMPQRTTYLSQSSGKALDALVMGLPVVAVSGSYPAEHSARWAGTDLSYADSESAAETLFGLIEETWPVRASLAQRFEEIRGHYSPASSVLHLMSLTDELSGGAESPRTVSVVPVHQEPSTLEKSRWAVLRATRVARQVAALGRS